jgi:sugar phosphate isomerase/epimerase
MSFGFSYNAIAYHGEDLAVSIDRLARYGYDGIELVGEPADHDVPRVKRLCAQAGLSVSSICSIYTPERDLVHPDAAVRQAAVEYVIEVARFASELDCLTVIVHPTACMKTSALADRAQERAWAVEGIRQAGEEAEKLGVSLSLECWNRYETYFLNRLEQALDLWEATGLSNGGVQGDTFHMNLEEESIPAAFRQAGPHLQHVHLADSNRAAPGAGHLDFGPILQALMDVEYGGWLTFELLPPFADPFAAMSAGGQEAFLDPYTEQAIEHIRSCLGALEDVAR